MVAIFRIVALLALYCACLPNPAEGHPLQKQCHISKYKIIPLSIMSSARMLQNLQQPRRSCHQGLLLKNFRNCDIQGKERLMLTLHRVSLVVKILKNMNQTELVEKNLDAFSILETDLINCEMAKSPELKNCQNHLCQYRETVTKECLENDVLLSLVWILTEDVGCLIYGEQSAEGTEKMDLQVIAKPPPAEKHTGKKKRKSKKNKKNAN